MQSSFKKQYEFQPQPDGSALLTVKSRRSGAFASSSAPGALAFLILIVYVGAFIGLAFLGMTLGGNQFLDRHGGKAALVALAAPVLLLRFAFAARSLAIQLRPQGIEFDQGKKRVALKDIKHFGVMTETVSGNGGHAQSAYVYLDALGQRIKLTGHMNQELAEAVRDDIVDYYNGKA